MNLLRLAAAVGLAVSLSCGSTAIAGPFGPSGSFSVSPSGAATYSLGLMVPPGSAGVQPALGVSYSSMGGDDLLGLGWTLTGFSSITRCPQTIATYGVKKGVQLTSEDRFCLDGQPLIQVSAGVYGQDGVQYETESKSYTRITSNGTSGTGPAWFRVESRNGTIAEYGSDGITYLTGSATSTDATGSGSQLRTPGHASSSSPNTVIRWNINKSYDRSGNTITYKYWNSWSWDANAGISWITQVPVQISYGANATPGAGHGDYATIDFVNENRNTTNWEDRSVSYVGGHALLQSMRIARIRTSYAPVGQASVPVRDYIFKYDAGSNNRSRLVGFQECALANCVWNDLGNTQTLQDGNQTIPVRFSYYNGDLGKLSTTWPSGPAHLYASTGYSYSGFIPVLGDFNGDGRSDVLFYHPTSNDRSIWMSNSNDTFSFVGGPGVQQFAGHRAVIGDFNGDGKSDVMLYAQTVGCDLAAGCDPLAGTYTPLVGQIGTWLSNGDGTFVFRSQTLTFAQPSPLQLQAAYVSPTVGDFNGDGRSDVLWSLETNTGYGYGYRVMWTGIGDGTFNQTLNYAGLDGTLPGYSPQTADFNGDGLTDVLWTQLNGFGVEQDSRAIWTTLPSGGVSVDNNVGGANGMVGGNSRFIPVDLNGDGKSDLFVHSTNAATGLNAGQYQIWFARGNGTFTIIPNPGLMNGKYVNATPAFGDFNGDGATDIHFELRDGNNVGTGPRWLQLGSASGLSWTEIGYTAATGYPVIGNNPWGIGAQALVGDFDGDGKSDLFLDQKSGPEGRSAGSGGLLRNPFGATGNATVTGLPLVDQVYGVSDLLREVNDGANRRTLIEYLPLTRQTQWGPFYFVSQAPAYPNFVSTDPRQVVRITQSSNGVPGSLNSLGYSYENATSNLLGRGSTGFTGFYVWDPVASINNNSYFNTEWPRTGTLSANSVWWHTPTGVDRQITGTTNTYQEQTTFGIGGPAIKWVYLAASDTSKWDLTTTFISRTKTDNTFDSNGNLTQSISKQLNALGADEGTSTTTVSAYNPPNQTKWIWGQPACTAVTTVSPGAASRTRTTSFEYGTVFLAKTVVEPGTNCAGAVASTDASLRVNTTIDNRDPYGNVTQVTVSGAVASGVPGYFEPRTSNIDYMGTGNTGRGRLALTESMPSGKAGALAVHATKTTYDDATGLVLSKEVLKGSTSAVNDGLTASFTYSPLGRKKSETGPDGVTTTFSYGLCDSSCGTWNNFMYWVAQDTPGRPGSYQLNDIFDRGVQYVVLDQAPSETSPVWRVRSYNEYDSLGRVWRTWNAFASGTTPDRNVTRSFDALGRPLQVWDQEGYLTTYSYDGRTSASTDPRGVISRGTLDGLGRTIETVQSSGTADEVRVQYVYDALNNATSVVTKAGTATRTTHLMTYDLKGRKISSNDPDTGAYTYAYDALGQLTGQTGPLGLTSMTYDHAGRVLTRVDPDSSATFAYDAIEAGCAASSKPRGKLTRTETLSGAKSLYCFDDKGRAANVTRAYSFNGTQQSGLKQSLSYDAQGRVATSVYSNTFGPAVSVGIQNNYSPLGYLSTVTDLANANWQHWVIEERDPAGRVKTERFGRNTGAIAQQPGTWAQNTYGPRNGLDNTFVSNGLTGTGLQYHTYSYDSVMNVQTRQWWDGAAMRTESFTHDNLDRLRQVTGASSKTYTYDDIGNLKTKDGLTLNYPAPTAIRPHAVSSVTGSVNGIVNPTYTYDAAGNLKSECPGGNCAAPSRQVQWSAASYPTRITRPATNTTMDLWYDADRARVKQNVVSSSGTTTIYYGPGGFERTDEGGVTTYKVYMGFGTISVAASTGVKSYRYVHNDRQGSPLMIVDEAVAVVERESFDAWGQRRNADGTDSASASSVERRGYTSHEHLTSVKMIHMNGRIYDPTLARFASADPLVPSPGLQQSYNRYSYVNNNPMRFTDPSGFSPFTKLRNADFGYRVMRSGMAVRQGFRNSNTGAAMLNGTHWIAPGSSAIDGYFRDHPNAQKFAMAAANVGCISTGPYAPLCAAAISAYATANNGGDNDAIAESGIRAGVVAAAFTAVGQSGLGDVGMIGAHAAIGCAQGAMSDQGCARGALSAAAGKGGTIYAGGSLALTALAGGAASWIGGGRFADGVLTAVIGYAYNNCSNPNNCTLYEAVTTVAEGAWSIVTGTGNALRFVARGIGLMGPEEYAKWQQEGKAVEKFAEQYANDPEFRREINRTAARSYQKANTEENKWFVTGRASAGIFTGFGPAAAVGDATRGVEAGRDMVDAFIRGGVVGRPN